MIWLFAAVGLVVLVAVFDRPFRLSNTVLVIAGAILVIGGFSQLAYVEWHYISAGNKPLDVSLPLDKAGSLRPPAFLIDRTGEYDAWLQTDRPSALLAPGCDDPGYGGAKPCPPLQLNWTVSDDTRVLGVTYTLFDGAAPHAKTLGNTHTPPASNPPTAAGDGTPKYRFLGSFHAGKTGPYRVSIDVVASDPLLAARHPRLIIGLSSAETAPVGYTATLFCVLCVLGGGFMLLKGLVPRNASP